MVKKQNLKIVERVAFAMFLAHKGEKDYGKLAGKYYNNQFNELLREEYLNMARAAIEVIAAEAESRAAMKHDKNAWRGHETYMMAEELRYFAHALKVH